MRTDKKEGQSNAKRTESSQLAAQSPLGKAFFVTKHDIRYFDRDVYADAYLTQHKFDRSAEQIRYWGSKITTQPVTSLEAFSLLKPDLILGEEWQNTQGKKLTELHLKYLYKNTAILDWIETGCRGYP